MKKMINIRNGVIIVLCITIICLGIGFILVSMQLNKYQKVVNNYDVSFVSYSKDASTKGGKVAPEGILEINNNGKELDLDLNLNVAHDALSYKVLIKNNGNIKSEITDLIATPDYNDLRFKKYIDPVSITYSDIVGEVLEPGEEVELKISAYYSPSTLKGARNINYKLVLVTQTKLD